MKLRNRENNLTGKLTHIDFDIDDSESEIDLSIMLDNSDGECIDRQFYSLDELKKFLRDWEGCKPLIKDEKIRKAVRTWAEANEYPKTMELYYNAPNFVLRSDISTIEFDKEIEPLQHGDQYTISELCGEEEQ